MATVFSWSSSADAWTFTTGAQPAYTSGGTYGERTVWPATTAAAFADADLPSALTDFGCRFIYSLASGATSSHSILTGLNGSAQVFRVDITTAQHIRIRDATNTALAETVTGPFSYGVEQRFEIFRSGTTLTVKQYLVSDNSLQITLTATVGSTPIDSVHFGNQAAITGTLGSFTYDEVRVTDTAAEVGAPGTVTPLSATVVASPTGGTPPYTQTLTVSASGGTGTYSYQVVNWGDGTTSPPQSSNVFTKLITAGTPAGTKTYTVRVTG